MKLKVARIAAIAGALLVSSVWAQQPQQNWKDRAEYDMFQDMAKETDPAKRLEKIKAWADKYPTSDFKKEGLTLRVNTFAQLQKFPELIAAAKEVLALDPADLTSLYWITSLTRSLNNTSPEALDLGDKSANQLLSNLDKIFAAEKKPANTPPDAWAKARSDMEALGMKTLAWIAMARKDLPKSEESIGALLAKHPKDGEATYWMYTTIVNQKKQERYSEALYYLARAASLPQAEGGLGDAQRKQVEDFFVRAYTRFHGKDDAGLAELRKMALATPKPPADFKILSHVDIGQKQDEELRKTQPQLYYWRNLKKNLEGEASFFEQMKGAALPGKIEGTELTKLKGTLVKATPETNPKELTIQMDPDEAPGTPAVTIKLEKPLRGKADAGQELQFEGVADAFTKEPFNLTFTAEVDQISGWPTPAPTPKKAAPAKKAPVRKKK